MQSWQAHTTGNAEDNPSATTPRSTRKWLWFFVLLCFLASCDFLGDDILELDPNLFPGLFPNSIIMLSAEGEGLTQIGDEDKFNFRGNGQSKLTLIATIPKDASTRQITFAISPGAGTLEHDFDLDRKVTVRANEVLNDTLLVARTVLISPMRGMENITVTVSASVSEFTDFIEIEFLKQE